MLPSPENTRQHASADGDHAAEFENAHAAFGSQLTYIGPRQQDSPAGDSPGASRTGIDFNVVRYRRVPEILGNAPWSAPQPESPTHAIRPATRSDQIFLATSVPAFY
jgi:hypothetical protein